MRRAGQLRLLPKGGIQGSLSRLAEPELRARFGVECIPCSGGAASLGCVYGFLLHLLNSTASACEKSLRFRHEFESVGSESTYPNLVQCVVWVRMPVSTAIPMHSVLALTPSAIWCTLYRAMICFTMITQDTQKVPGLP